ncbi:SDR family oxidoreductase [Acetobacter okinawensis]|uniref:SDR family oxidoreductase n=1 Tax=Acetobacter okinawensis TaxID=1076594 RepID=UPI0004712DEB|nr:SDR family oxidoreductase [Acetobacter okinawensis]MBS0965811.1 SDR family oxidoreductase [Acetobacter okinawensis]
MPVDMLPISPAIPRRALVSGGGARLGRAIVLALAQAGFDVAIHYRSNRAEAEETAHAVRALGRSACVLQADLMREEQVQALYGQATQALGGPLGVLVNNASTFERDEWDDASLESWMMHMKPNLRAPFVLMQAFAKGLPQGAQGMVLNMLDERVWSLTPHFVSYTVSKTALWTLTQSMALALAPKGIRVNAIGPGPALPSPRQTQEQFARQCASVPLAHGTTPEEVARAALALLALPSVTGQMLALDGGQHLQWSPAPLAGHAVEE